MKNRYNFSLMPVTINDVVVRLAHLFGAIADKYLLGKKSLPHVTLCQFEAEEDEIDSIWEKVVKSGEKNQLILRLKNLVA